MTNLLLRSLSNGLMNKKRSSSRPFSAASRSSRKKKAPPPPPRRKAKPPVPESYSDEYTESSADYSQDSSYVSGGTYA